jgi:hypothetical protein
MSLMTARQAVDDIDRGTSFDSDVALTPAGVDRFTCGRLINEDAFAVVLLPLLAV